MLAAAPAAAQVGLPSHDGTPSVATGSVPLTYTGGDTRASVGVDQDGNTQGELAQVFGNNGEHAIVAQLWWGHGGAGGIQADYNWLFGTTLDEARRNPDSVTVAKLSFAIDQNEDKARQANVALAIERKEFFLNFFLSGKASGAHTSGVASVQQQQTQNGSDDTGTYTQTRTDIATTLLLSQPYAYTVGVHGGHFSDALTARFNGGFDYAHGDQGASQKRVSVSVDKYIGTRGWSVSGVAEHAQNTSVVGSDSSDNRWWLFLRYEFGGGGAFRPYADAAGASTAWISRALHEPVTGHSRTVETYVTRGKTTTTTTVTPKQYTARFPIARDDTASIAADSNGIDIDVLGNDTDPDNGTLSISAAGPASHGTVQVGGAQVHYTPVAGYSGPDQFAYTIKGSKGLTASATVHVTITPGPPGHGGSPPVARDDTTTTAFGKPVAIAVLGNDADPNGYALTVTTATSPAHGSAHVNADNTITYTPAAGFSGSDRFGYTIDNGHGGTASASVAVVVQPAPPPIAIDDSATTPFGVPVDISVLANDSDPAGYPLTVVSLTTPSSGSATILAGGSVRYTPGGDFSGVDHFGYTISDGHGGSASATVTVTVLDFVTALQARPDSAETAYATPVTIDVLANDTGPSGKNLIIKSVTAPQHGTVTIVSGGIRYVPSADFVGGTDTFTYTVGDTLEAATANVSVRVLPPGNPVAQNDSATTPFNQPVAINVLANDSTPAPYPLTVSAIATPPVHGSAAINGNNTITYTPQATFTGTDTFAYTVSDGHGGSANATVSVTVQAPLPPVANPDTKITAFQTPVQIGVLGNDSDPNGLPLTIVSITAPPTYQGTVSQGPTSLTFTPDAEFTGDATFSYTISNGYNTASANVTVTVQLPAQPLATNFSFSGPPPCYQDGNTCDICLDDHIANPSGLGYTVSVTGSTQLGGSVVVAPLNGCTNNATYASPDPTDASNLNDSFTYTVKDEFNRMSTATVSVSITYTIL